VREDKRRKNEQGVEENTSTKRRRKTLGALGKGDGARSALFAEGAGFSQRGVWGEAPFQLTRKGATPKVVRCGSNKVQERAPENPVWSQLNTLKLEKAQKGKPNQ